MKLKLLFFMGILSVFCNTMNASNTGPVIPKPVSLPPTISADKLVQMNIDPQVTCPGVIVANIVFYIDDDQTIFPSLVVTATSDNQALVPDANLAIYGASLGDRFLTVTPLSGLEGVANITITVKDGDNQTSSLTFKVTTVDNSSPSISSVSDQSGNVGGGCQFIIPDYTGLATATDDCLAPAITQSPIAGVIVGIGSTVVTLIATDSVGKTATTTFNVNVTDVEKPVITTSGDITENNTSGICGWTPSPVPSATATDNCTPMSNTPSGSRSDMLALDADYPVGTTTITWMVTDNNGNTATATQTVTVNDVENPTVIAQNITVELDNLGSATITPSQIDNGSYDNCTIDTRLLDTSSFTCANLGANTVVLTVTDTAGNTATSSATVTVVDKIAPVITTIGNQVLDNVPGQCGRFIPVGTSGGLVIEDNCTATGAIVVTRTRSDGLSRYNPFPVGITTVTWTATDASGNMSSASITVTVNDVEKPVITTSGDITENNTSGICGWTPSPVPSATATDNCTPMSNTPSGSRSDMLALDADYPVGTTTITWMVTDNNGNTATATQTVTVNDVENPTAIAQNITVELDNLGSASITPTQIDNGSYDNCGVAASLTLSLDITDFNCSNLGANTVVLTVTDTAGNAATSSATVTVVDKIAPVITTIGNQVLDNAPGQCGRFIPVGTSGGLVIEDNCTATGAIVITRTRSDGLSRYNPFPVGITTVTWTATDASGNMSSASITVTVKDVESPSFGSGVPATLVQNDLGECSYATSQLPIPFVSDNCPFTGTVTVSPASIPVSSGPDHLPSTVTWTATDTAGNVASATQLVTVQDIEYPVVRTKNITRYFDANGQIVILPSDIDNGTTDNSGTSCLTQYVVPNILYCGNKGDNSVILTVTDLYGNQSYKEATVTAIDDINPTITAPADVVLNTNTACTWVGTLALPTTADNCSVVSVTNDAPVALPVGNTTVIWTVTDASGNTATATQVVTVNDIEKPIAIAKVGYTVALDTDGKATIVAADIDNGSSDNCTIDTMSVLPSTFDCSNVGANTVTLTVTDNSGNISTVNTIVTVVDAIAPVAVTKPFVAQLSATGVVTILASDVVDSAVDNCGIKTIVVSPNTFACANLGDNTVTVTVTDNNNNVIIGTAIVTVEDTISPTIATTNIIVNTNSGCTWNGTLALPITADNCSVVSITSDKIASFAFPIGDTTVNWTVTDTAGNIATATQVVTVKDVEKPIANSSDIQVKLDADGEATIAIADIDNGSSDNCGIKSLALSKTSFDCDNVGSNRVTLTVTDNSDNVSTVDAIVTVVDAIAPVAIAQSITVQLNSIGGVSITAAQINDGSTDNCGIKSMTVVPSTFTCANVGDNTVTLTVTDNSNNVSTVDAIVTVEDTNGPVVVTKSFSAYLDASGSVSILAADVHLSSVDACGIKSMTVSPSTFTCDDIGDNTVELSVTDINDNVTKENAVVTVLDKIAPVVTTKPITVPLDATGTAVITSADVNNVSTDNCGIVQYILNKSVFGCSDIGLNPVTLTAIDESGNASIPTTALVTVVDVTAPTVITKDIIVTLNVSGTATIVASDVNNGSTDACGIASYSIDRTSFSCSDTGNPVTVTLTAIDIHGNVSSSTAQVTVKDTILPVARTRNITVQLDAAGTVSILPSDINNGSTDNCGIITYSLSKDTFTCANVGTNIVTLTAIDASGNEHSATATVTVQDNKAPIVLTKSFTAQLDATGTVTITPADVDNVSTDNCGIITYSLSKDTFTCANVGSNVISLTATDASGNSTSAFATVIVEDNIAPVVITKNIELVLNHGTVSIVPADVLVSATDACGVDITSYSLSQDTFTIVDVLASPVTITVYVTDINGNVGSATATITFPTKPVEAVEVITPNGDGINDTWVIANITNHPKSIVRVYNTWGSIVFSAKNYQNNWDGKLNGSDVTLPDGGTYYYQVDLEGTGSIDSEGWLYITRQ